MTFSAIDQWEARMLFCLRIIEIPALADQIALFALQRTTQKQAKQRPHFHEYCVKSRDISTFANYHGKYDRANVCPINLVCSNFVGDN